MYKKILFFLIFLFFWISYFLLNKWLLENGIASDALIYLGEKTQLLFAGITPREANLILILPLLPYLLSLPFINPFLASSFWGALAISSVLFGFYNLHRQKQIRLVTLITLSIFIILSPPFVLFFAQMSSELLQTLLLCFSVYFLRRYYFERIALYLFLFGLTSGLYATGDIHTYLLPLVFLPALLFIIHSQRRPYLPLLIAGYYATAVFMITPYFLNWLFRDQFNVAYGNSLLSETLVTASLSDGFLLLMSYLSIAALFLSPYILMYLRLDRYASKIAYLTFAIIPLLVIFIKIQQNTWVFGAYSCVFVLLYTCLLFTKVFGPRYERHYGWTLLITGLLAISYFGSFTLGLSSFDPNERAFNELILHRHINKVPLKEALDAAQFLTSKRGLILADDEINYPTIYLTKNITRFILPHQPSFETVLSNPKRFVQYILMTKTPKGDQISQSFPSAILGEIPSFEVVYRSQDLIIFENNDYMESL